MNRKLLNLMLYAILDTTAHKVKLGISNNPSRRLRCLQTGNSSKLQLLWVIDGFGRTEERKLHHALARYRVGGEWFDEKVLQFLNPTSAHIIIA
ncbi:MAG: GIY-YIG nuclease family protein [Pelatocladus maniniholoensis HA4357-MV3]|jgi:hypothetical protein|uniref:GIY-YIG nuclease family protein n=1 Tax=Pelatocladus maniniholoensis HA4357-MV3 TaxID=1117104 RepID=A0A9E3LV43_9NOST|nr:GIY-YIG nuclease family protein [Pelatocladus maniniholoensis HA4357-MV3]